MQRKMEQVATLFKRIQSPDLNEVFMVSVVAVLKFVNGFSGCGTVISGLTFTYSTEVLFSFMYTLFYLFNTFFYMDI